MSPFRYGFFIELIYKSFVPDNITNLCIFNDDQQILHEMANADVFKNATIDKDEHDKVLQYEARASKENHTLKGVLSLEKLYDLQNHLRVLINVKTHSSIMLHKQMNLGTKNDLKFVNLDTHYMPQEWKSFICLFNQYRDVFVWTYDDIKTYDT